MVMMNIDDVDSWQYCNDRQRHNRHLSACWHQSCADTTFRQQHPASWGIRPRFPHQQCSSHRQWHSSHRSQDQRYCRTSRCWRPSCREFQIINCRCFPRQHKRAKNCGRGHRLYKIIVVVIGFTDEWMRRSESWKFCHGTATDERSCRHVIPFRARSFRFCFLWARF